MVRTSAQGRSSGLGSGGSFPSLRLRLRFVLEGFSLGRSMGKKKKGRPRGRGGYANDQRGRRSSLEPINNNQVEPVADNGEAGPLQPGGGVLELHPNGYGFLRDPNANYVRQMTDPFVPGSMIEKFGLREGVCIQGMVQPGRRQQGPRLKEITDVDCMKPEEYRNVKTFDQLTPINPESWLRLETGAAMTTRVMDLLTPLGKASGPDRRPARTGKTILLQHISQAISPITPTSSWSSS